MILPKLKVVLLFACFLAAANARGQASSLKLVFIRHGEKPLKGSNLTCQGLNRALKLPAVLYKKFGKPNYLMVPAMGLGDTTLHARMFQTIGPFAMKYNLPINSSHQERDYAQIAADLKSRNGTTIITWEHKAIPFIVNELGIKASLTWPDDDFDSIWIVTFKKGEPVLVKTKEGIKPGKGCLI